MFFTHDELFHSNLNLGKIWKIWNENNFDGRVSINKRKNYEFKN